MSLFPVVIPLGYTRQRNGKRQDKRTQEKTRVGKTNKSIEIKTREDKTHKTRQDIQDKTQETTRHKTRQGAQDT